MPPHLFIYFRASFSHIFPGTNSCMISQTRRCCFRSNQDFILLDMGEIFIVDLNLVHIYTDKLILQLCSVPIKTKIITKLMKISE